MHRITDVHVHIQPWRDLKPKVQEAMRRGKEAHWEFLQSIMDDPQALLQILDQSGVWRIGMVNYPSPDVMGFTNSTNTFAAKYAQANPERLLPYGGVDARHTKDPAGDVDRLVDLGIRLCKIHPPHQRYAANAYADGLETLGQIYKRCEARGLPVMVHTGTSIFPGARSKYGNPMELGYNHPMGPLKLTDLVGLDVRLAIAEYLHATLGKPHYEPPKILRDKVKKGELGRKTGKGFYTWSD